ncbi:hypothetical protein NEHOM01_0615 [Nematocida homosporus]|uniref:uncharacterized protein n=1 Tax=Nematocida homosporus TaxID=1912981 RepID=UPI00221E8B09|nr:uncharacterized protein NEHOM01_0615 [Nematocida homosporus]KAI5185110.1 hypothetical protein NEHOM01_0615 [Nematocida homosporus]
MKTVTTGDADVIQPKPAPIHISSTPPRAPTTEVLNERVMADKLWVGVLITSVLALLGGSLAFLVTTQNLDVVAIALSQITWTSIFLTIVLPIAISLGVLEVVLFLLRAIPLITIHVSYILTMLVAPIAALLVFPRTDLLIIECVLWFIISLIVYIVIFHRLQKAADLLKIVAELLLKNQPILLSYLFGGLILIGPFLFIVWAAFIVNYQNPAVGNEQYPIFFWTAFVGTVWALVFIIHAGDVFFAHIFSILAPGITSSTLSIIHSGFQQIIQSCGTIFLGTILQTILLAARSILQFASKKEIFNRRNPRSIRNALLAIYGLITSLLKLLDLSIGLCTQYALVLAGINGTSFHDSINDSNTLSDAKLGFPLTFFPAMILSSVVSIISGLFFCTTIGATILTGLTSATLISATLIPILGISAISSSALALIAIAITAQNPPK